MRLQSALMWYGSFAMHVADSLLGRLSLTRMSTCTSHLSIQVWYGLFPQGNKSCNRQSEYCTISARSGSQDLDEVGSEEKMENKPKLHAR